MTACSAPVVAAGNLAVRLRELVSGRCIEAIVQTGCTHHGLTRELLELGPPVSAIDVRPQAIAALRDALGEHAGRIRILQGRPSRVLADLRCQRPERTLYVFGHHNPLAPTLREELFWVPRGRGVVVVLLDADAGVGGYADVQDQLLRWSPDHHVEWHTTSEGGVALVALPRPRVHVTFLIEKYTHEYEKSGISINLDNLVETLSATGLATSNVVHYDECFHEARPIPLEQISPPATADVHVLACTLHYHSRANPSIALLEQVKARGSRVAFFWLDKKISQATPDYYRTADLNVVLDGNDFDLPNAWPCYTPKNPRFFHDPGRVRDIGVSLVGEVRYLSQRKAMVDRLRDETRVAVRMFATSAADTGRVLSVAEYAQLYQRSRISLAMTKDRTRQLKGRVFEIVHCGALLLCDVNHHVSHYFDPGVEYVVYGDYEDLVQKASYYLTHEDERQAIAAAGHRRAVSHYNHEVFWRSLLARLQASAAGRHERA
ncbi:MAG: glycosyltransferase [Planctomycetota bacterium]